MHAKPKAQSPTLTAQVPDQPQINPTDSLDVSELTFEQAQQVVEQRNHNRSSYGLPNTTIQIVFGDDSSRAAYSRANSDPAAVLYGDLPNSFWARLLSFLERASNDPSSYTNRRDAVLMREAIRQKLHERGF